MNNNHLFTFYLIIPIAIVSVSLDGLARFFKNLLYVFILRFFKGTLNSCSSSLGFEYDVN